MSPLRQQQLHQLNNALQEFGRDAQWEEIQKQFKHDPSKPTIDWAYLEEQFPFPALVKGFKEEIEKSKWQEHKFEEELKEFTEIGLQAAWESHCQQQAMDKALPRLERQLAKLRHVRDNVREINLEQARQLDPELFKKLDKEVDELNWDDDPAAPETFAAYNKAENERRAHSHH